MPLTLRHYPVNPKTEAEKKNIPNSQGKIETRKGGNQNKNKKHKTKKGGQTEKTEVPRRRATPLAKQMNEHTLSEEYLVKGNREQVDRTGCMEPSKESPILL